MTDIREAERPRVGCVLLSLPCAICCCCRFSTRLAVSNCVAAVASATAMTPLPPSKKHFPAWMDMIDLLPPLSSEHRSPAWLDKRYAVGTSASGVGGGGADLQQADVAASSASSAQSASAAATSNPAVVFSDQQDRGMMASEDRARASIAQLPPWLKAQQTKDYYQTRDAAFNKFLAGGYRDVAASSASSAHTASAAATSNPAAVLDDEDDGMMASEDSMRVLSLLLGFACLIVCHLGFLSSNWFESLSLLPMCRVNARGRPR